MKITIDNKQIELKYSFRALMIYENIQNKAFEPQSLTDIITFFYAVVIGSNNGETIVFDKFIDWLDENPKAIQEFSTWLADTVTANNYLSPKGKNETKKGKVSKPKN